MRRHAGRIWLVALCLLLAAALVACSQEAVEEHVVSPTARPTPAESSAQPTTDEAMPSPTLEPTVEPTPEPTFAVLKKGVGDSDTVRQVQERLIELGYLAASATGHYGDATTAAVVDFQNECGLAMPDGMVGQDTWNALFDENAPRRVVAVPVATDSPETVDVQGVIQPQQPQGGTTGLPLAGITIGLDPGHQGKGNNEHEPVGPGSSQTKPKVSSGTQGVATGVPEHVVNLAVGLKLRDLLQAQGATVVMTRESPDVNISNAERAQLFNNSGVDLAVRLHCDGETDQSRHGAFVLIPSGPYAETISASSREAGQCVLDAFVAATGAKSLGLSERSDQTGFNWSTVPVINIEMGHMSNAAEDQKLCDDSYQQLCAQGIAQGIVDYFT